MRRFLATVTLPFVFAVSAAAHETGRPATTAEEVHPLLIGAEVPTLTLRTADGSPFHLDKAVRSKPAIVIFYRGGW